MYHQTIAEYMALGGKITKIPYDEASVSYKKFQGIKYKCKKDNIPFDLTLRWIAKRIKNGKCEATGIEFSQEDREIRVGYSPGIPKEDYLNKKIEYERPSPWTPSVDRIDSTRGYTQDNCWIVCWAFNRAKAENDVSILVKLAEHIVAKKYNILKKSFTEE